MDAFGEELDEQFGCMSARYSTIWLGTVSQIPRIPNYFHNPPQMKVLCLIIALAQISYLLAKYVKTSASYQIWCEGNCEKDVIAASEPGVVLMGGGVSSFPLPSPLSLIRALERHR